MAASFEDRLTASQVRRKALREHHLVSTAYSCDKCGKFHLGLNEAQTSVLERKVVRLMASGLTVREISVDLRLRPINVRKVIEKMKRRVYATSAANLVALCIFFGELDLTGLLPVVEPRTHL